jgi:hypothetical protein
MAEDIQFTPLKEFPIKWQGLMPLFIIVCYETTTKY